MSPSPARIEMSDPKAYQNRMLGLLGGREPLAVLSSTADILAEIVRKHGAPTMRQRPYEGKWTPTEIIGHLADAEWTYGFRVRMIISEDRPKLLPMDQEKWVIAQRYNERDPAELVELFRGLRGGNLAIWRGLPPADFERVGMHVERGPESLGLMFRMNAGHDLSHIDQITRYLAAIEGR